MKEKNTFLYVISSWFRKTFADPAAVSLFLTLVFAILFFKFFGKLMLPVLVSIVIAYLLNSLVKLLQRWGLPHLFAVIIVFLVFLGLLIFAVVGLIPLLSKQLSNLVEELPQTLNQSQLWFNEFRLKFPTLFADVELQNMIVFFKAQTAKIGQSILHISFTIIPGAIQFILYFILVPLLVFFFLKDSKQIMGWFERFMPSHRTLVVRVWSEVHEKIGAYVRGRVLEVLLVGLVTAMVFDILGLQYAVLLGALTGLSAIVPYIGGIVVTIPIVIVALLQWGLSAHFVYLIIAYAIIIALDANLLVPLLFAGTMNLHPVVIIISVLVFGALWGFWGIFFAIPLATVINAVLHAWPRAKVKG